MNQPAAPGARRRWYVAGLAVALLCAFLAAWPLLAARGIVNTRGGGDSPFLLQRVYELQANLRAGVFPARWMPDAAYGLGYPFFNYYASLPYYLAAGLNLAGVGILWAIKLTQLIGYLAAAAAAYALAHELFDDEAAALLVAAAYTFAPFHLVNTYVRGDSLSEFYAFVFYPLILWGLVRLRRRPSAGALVLLALSYAGLMLTHNVSALIFTPLAGTALLVAAATAERDRMRVFIVGAGGFFLGAAASVWFWGPALLERDAVSLEVMTTGYFNYSSHFRGSNLVQWLALFDYRVDGQRSPFVVGGAQAVLTLLGLALVLAGWWRARRVRWLDVALVAALVYAVWPITPTSRFVWDRVSLLQMAQFPWRFLSITALAAALVAGAGFRRLPKSPRLKKSVALVLTALLAVCALGSLKPDVLPLRDADVTPARLQLYEHLTGNIGTTVRGEYLPAPARPQPSTSEALLTGEAHPAPRAVSGSLEAAQLVDNGPIEQRWQVNVTSPTASLVFQTYCFPGWVATIDGRPADIDPELANGRIAVSVPAGEHQVILRLGSTPLRTRSEGMALGAALVLLAFLLVALWRARARWRRIGLAVAGVVAGSLLLIGIGAAATRVLALPQTDLATETTDFWEMPYLHPNPQGIGFGALLRLQGYDPLPEVAQVGDRIHVRLHWENASAEEGVEVQVGITSMAGPIFQTADLATDTQPLAAVTEHTLTVPAEVTPGLALVSVRLVGARSGVVATTASGRGLGTLYLAPVRITTPALPQPERALARLSDNVEILAAGATQSVANKLQVRLSWRVQQPLPEDYVVSLRLYDADGRQVQGAALDLQPRYGGYPTSLWPANTSIADYYELPLPAGTPPGAGYQLEVKMYQARTLAALGTVRLPNIAVTVPTVDPDARPLIAFEQGLAITSWRLERAELEDGEEIVAHAQWTFNGDGLQQVAASSATGVSCRISLVDEQNREVAAQSLPLAERYPLSAWPLHALVNADLRLRVPYSTPSGRYSLQLVLLGPGGAEIGRRSPPDTVQIRAAQRQMVLPAFAHAVGADWGTIRLAGFDEERTATQLTLTLHWQALAVPEHDYKIFLHCYDPATEKIVAQRDIEPADGAWSTSRWAPGQVVSDRLTLDMAQVPHGHYQLAVGWYDPANNDRLTPNGPGAEAGSKRLLLEAIDW